MIRSARVSRKTKETSIDLSLTLDGTGKSEIATPVGFLSHMLDALARHGRFDLRVSAEGDVHIDAHHTVEDTGLALGEALDRALGDRAGISRFGHAYVPLDEALARSVVDLSGRPFLVFESPEKWEGVWVTPDFAFPLVEEFWKSVAFRARLALHVDVLRGTNGHHIAEAVFKASARALAMAVARSGEDIPSTKGTLTV